MTLTCLLDPVAYPNCGYVQDLIKKWCGEKPGEVRISGDPQDGNRVCLQFHYRLAGKRMHFCCWSVNAGMFKTKDSLNALNRVTTEFLATLPKEARPGCIGAE